MLHSSFPFEEDCSALATNTTSPGTHKSSLFLGDLSAFCTERDIHETFSPYGDILEIKIMRSEDSQRNLSYGFIKFASSAAAKKALNGLNGVLFCGRNLRYVSRLSGVCDVISLTTMLADLAGRDTRARRRNTYNTTIA
jgi:cold-inducible RNA-binding protein